MHRSPAHRALPERLQRGKLTLLPHQGHAPVNTENHSQTAAFLWSIADLLRGDFKQSQYGRIILPFTLLRRMECVLEPTKEAVIRESYAQ